MRPHVFLDLTNHKRKPGCKNLAHQWRLFDIQSPAVTQMLEVWMIVIQNQGNIFAREWFVLWIAPAGSQFPQWPLCSQRLFEYREKRAVTVNDNFDCGRQSP
ncbi:hypothetical protein CEG18_28850 [Pseudomonas nitroreducens]|uniref:Uncharacterized protein n=1 Tax=Pseudomonas nitroreducens TaxID=46680 RepID=A0A246F2M1_PSENT|nr:hypothetical protein CEG18_29960 [Pseudomonas nitroreducens]OWP47431.1 hypothetical protein CEG18_28850 [Pseudomonas nitroreducens]